VTPVRTERFFAAGFNCYLLLTLFLACWVFTLIMEAIRSSETLVLTTAAWRHIPEDSNLQSQTVKSSYLT
jgi:hypothetical protein